MYNVQAVSSIDMYNVQAVSSIDMYNVQAVSSIDMYNVQAVSRIDMYNQSVHMCTHNAQAVCIHACALVRCASVCVCARARAGGRAGVPAAI
jgi:hypothetical protein